MVCASVGRCAPVASQLELLNGAVLIALRAVALASLLVLAACTTAGRPATAGHSTAHPSAGHSGPPEQLTIAEARRAFAAFLPRFNGLPQGYSDAAARSVTTGAELQAQLFFKGASGSPITKLTHVTFYVPRLAGYPRWFWVAGQQGGSGAAGHLFVMVQSARSAPWKTAAALYDLDSAARMVHYLAEWVARDASGYATAVSPGELGLAVSPSAMPATYASYLDQRAPRLVRRLFKPGPYTTDYIASNNKIARGAGRYGWRDTDHQAPAQLPVYGLWLNTGAAFVIFFTYDTASWVAKSSSAALPARPSGREGTYVPPAFVIQGLGVSSVKAGTRLTATGVDRVLAFVQQRGTGPIYVMINNGAATGLRKSGPAVTPIA